MHAHTQTPRVHTHLLISNRYTTYSGFDDSHETIDHTSSDWSGGHPCLLLLEDPVQYVFFKESSDWGVSLEEILCVSDPLVYWVVRPSITVIRHRDIENQWTRRKTVVFSVSPCGKTTYPLSRLCVFIITDKAKSKGEEGRRCRYLRQRAESSKSRMEVCSFIPKKRRLGGWFYYSRINKRGESGEKMSL